MSHIILSVLLLSSTVGVAVSKHYCGNSFISASVFHQAKSCCGDSDCCHNETSFYQVKEDFSAPAILSAPVLAELDILSQNLSEEELLISPETEIQTPLFADSPPPPTIQKILSLKQAYRL